ncbi:ATP phosphoribosyltransferase regulatory subunit [Thermocrinis sp.]
MKRFIPEGERFFNFEDSRKLKDSFVKACELFVDYRFIQLPTLEVYQPEDAQFSRPFLIGTQSDGSYLALRSDWTISLIRFLNSLRKVDLPLKVFYWGPIFSTKDLEKFQMGIELVGYDFPEGEKEVISKLVGYLNSLGLKDLSVILGHMGIVKRLCKNERDRERLRKKNFFGLREEDVLHQLLKAYGGEEVLNQFSESFSEFSQECEDLRRLGRILESAGVKVLYDLSEVRMRDYYTGIVFEIFHPEVGYPIAGGGRYDNLFLESKAVGGAVYLEALLEVL